MKISKKSKQHTVKTAAEMAQYCLRQREVESDDLDKIGPIVIEEIGNENIYFVSVWQGTSHFCKNVC